MATLMLGQTFVLAEVGIKPGGDLDEAYMSNKELLKSKLEECPDYQTIKTKRDAEANTIKQQQDNRDQKHFSYKLYGVIIAAILVLLSSSWVLQTNQKSLNNQSWYPPQIL